MKWVLLNRQVGLSAEKAEAEPNVAAKKAEQEELICA
jgi:hypothetical protein